MKKIILPVATAVAFITGLTGCMATNPSVPMAGAATAVPSITEQEKQSSPTFADEQISARHARLLSRYHDFSQSTDRFLQVSDSTSICNLSEDGQWLVTHGKPEKDIQAMMSQINSKPGINSVNTIQSAFLTEGECVNGVPEGPFIGIGRYKTLTTSDNTQPITSTNRVRLEGSARDGMMNGTFVHLSDSEMTSNFGGQRQVIRSLTVTEGTVEDGKDTGTHLTITGQSQSPVLMTLVNNFKQTAMGPQTEVHSYQGSRLVSTVNLVNLVAHGWMTNHLMPVGQQKTCMIRGEIADNSACSGMVASSVAVKTVSDDVLSQLVRTDNLGQYMSPYTSDGVLAEWVNMGTSASIGSTAGSGVGAVAGNMIADKALESVPFGSLIGSVFGSAVGEEMGREAGISAAGGWENIRATSDRSFDSLTDMARYLAQRYGNEPTYTDAIKVTMQVYPEFQNAMAAAY